jgi:hypothetical protein
MNRRSFMLNCTSALLVSAGRLHAWDAFPEATDAKNESPYEALLGKPVDLASLGALQSWTSPESAQLIQKWLAADPQGVLKLLEFPWREEQFDIGVEWPEFRSVDKVVLKFATEQRVPAHGFARVEYWKGLTTLQGQWQALEDGKYLGVPTERDGGTWEYSFPAIRTCRIRLFLQSQKQVEIAGFEVYGSSRWKSGEVCIEWGHSQEEQNYDGWLESYNGRVAKVEPLSGTTMSGPLKWSSAAGNGKLGGIVARVLYTWGMDVDRTVLTVRCAAGDYSFLPGEILEDQPIDIPARGVYLRNNAVNLTATEFRVRNADRYRIHDAVSRLPEQTLENAKKHIHARRVSLSFIGVDSNNHKFGIAPDGHLVVGYGDPSFGKALRAQFGVFFDTTAAPMLFQKPTLVGKNLFQDEEAKHQELEEGWLPIIVTNWSENDLTFERTDYAVLSGLSDGLAESTLRGDEPASMISRLRIKNDSPVPQMAQYYVKPWKPAEGRSLRKYSDVSLIPEYSLPSEMPYGALPPDIQNAWTTILRGDIAVVIDQDREMAVCHFDTHGRGSLSLDSSLGAAKFSEVVHPGEQISLDLVMPGMPLPVADAAQLRHLDYDRLHEITVNYWKKLLAAGMNVEVPDSYMQNLFNASVHHFALVQTKDAKRNESYPNTAMFRYGSIGSESSPIIQAMDMLGMHGRVQKCLRAWLSTQGDTKPEGAYMSKEGGFYNFWPNLTVDQGAVLWALAEHYLYTRDKQWLSAFAKQIVDGCDFIIRERRRLMEQSAGEKKPLHYGLAPAGCLADSRDWEYSFMLNGYFYLGLKKSAIVLQDVDTTNAARIGAEAEDYLQAIRRVLKECVAISPVARLRDNTGVPTVPSYLGLRGFSSEVKDSVDPDARHAYAYDSTLGPLHLLKSEVVEPDSPEADWMLNCLEDRFFMFSPPLLQSRVDLGQLSTDWFNLGGFEKLQPYYVHYQDAYLQRDEIPNFLRGFFNTLLTIADPMTLTFQEELDEDGGEPHKTHEEAWFFHQFRFMLVMEKKTDLFLARGTPREWLQHGKRIVVNQAPSYFGALSYSIQSREREGEIEARVVPPNRQRPRALYLRLRHPEKAKIKQVTINGRPWSRFDPEKEWIEIPVDLREVAVIAKY